MKWQGFLITLVAVLLISGCTQPNPSNQNSSLTQKYCGNSACEIGEDSSNCCLDCGCPTGYICDGSSCKKSANCGDGVLDEGETSDSCCLDAGCPVGEQCINNVCVSQRPEITAYFIQTTESYSVTYLKAKGDDVGQITMTNSGNDDAKNVKVLLSSPSGYFSDKTINFGGLTKNVPTTKDVDLTFLDKVLDVTTDESTTVSAVITYSNSANKDFSSTESFTMQLAGRNYMTWGTPGMVSSWVTPTQPSIREFAAKATSGLPAGMSSSPPTTQKMAARWLFESMRSYGVHYVNDAHSSADYVQFPIETLRNKAGDCDDHAILYASLLEAIGMKSFLMLVPRHIFSGYIDSEGNVVPIETVANNFDDALAGGTYQYNKYINSTELIYPTQQWYSYPQVNLPESFTIQMPSITKEMGECTMAFNWEDFWVASAPVTFVNSGDAPGAGCAVVVTYQSGIIKGEDISCWTINPGETREITYQPDISFFGGTFTCVAY